MQPDTSTRDRLIDAMLDGLRRRGYHGLGLAEVLAAANAPKGVLYHHFKDGKSELAVAAIEKASADMLQRLDTLLTRSASFSDALRTWFEAAQKQLHASGFERGCPLAAIALQTSADDVEIRAALARAFEAIRSRLQSALEAAGLSPAQARRNATLIVAAYEGALIQTRVAGRGDAMAEAGAALFALLEAP
jgi:TetR/AcrR family transcriptional repressor of lmrAB and yxaGH operons